MTLNSMVKDREGTQFVVEFDRHPDQCPLCHRHVNVIPQIGAVKGDRLQLVYRCSASECDCYFVATYFREVRSRVFQLSFTAPWNAEEVSFQETIAKLSPTFVKIYNQAMAAESRRLDQLVGIGLRKALEFLIKDFASHQHPDQAEAIRKVQLGPCIDQYVTDTNIKDCAKRAAWLGNDETHYVRRWEDRDITDLKLLVRITTNWIDSVLLTQRYVAEMQPGTH